MPEIDVYGNHNSLKYDINNRHHTIAYGVVNSNEKLNFNIGQFCKLFRIPGMMEFVCLENNENNYSKDKMYVLS